MSLKAIQQITPKRTLERHRAITSLDKPVAFQPRSGSVFTLQQNVGNEAMSQLLKSGVIQAKLSVSQPGDPDELEAEGIAQRIASSPASSSATLHRKCSCSTGGATCAECEEQQVEQAKGIHRKSSTPWNDRGTLPDTFLQSAGQGRPLDAVVRESMEAHLGMDLSQVRIHDDHESAQSASSIDAQAYTAGNHIYFSSGNYAPQTNEGQKLLAHELVHVAQQRGNRARTETADAQEASRGANAATSMAGPRIQRQLGPMPLASGALLGRAWLALSPRVKALVADRAIDAALAAIDFFPGRVIVGEAWIFVKEGLIGFYKRLKSADQDIKISALDRIASIMAGTDDKFSWAFLKGLLKGFFIDGALGIFIAIWDLIKALRSLWQFLKGIGESIGGFPDEMREWLQHAQNFGEELASGFGAAIDQLKAMVLDPKQAGSFLVTIVEKGKGLARQAGGKVADALLNFFSNPEASAEIGETAGDIIGMILWEVVFAVLTAGGGAAVTAIKEAAAGLGKLVARIVAGILKVVEEIRLLIGKVVEVVKDAVKFVKGKLSELSGKLGKMLEDIGNFLGKILGSCHESQLTCKFRAQFEKIIRRITGTPGLEHSFDRHAAQWFGTAVNRATHFSKWQELIERASQSGKVFEWSVGADQTIAHLAQIEGKPFLVQFYKSGPRIGELVTAFVPNQSQLSAALAIMGK